MTNLLGYKIKKFRKDKDLTLDKLAELTESSKSYIWELENKSPPRPSAEKLSKIAEALGTTMEFLLDGDSAISPKDATLTAAQEKFYRQYKKMSPETQEKIHIIVEAFGTKK